jgi:hypothetical protein
MIKTVYQMLTMPRKSVTLSTTNGAEDCRPSYSMVRLSVGLSGPMLRPLVGHSTFERRAQKLNLSRANNYETRILQVCVMKDWF